uniref:Uncharacterized protein n=1 Tax=Meloidogyne enterolobii TaxID=390850 RepID=A0A6V7UZI0_MELEN|nr:unnamed protein product [Meloidogyne enterolobii]
MFIGFQFIFVLFFYFLTTIPLAVISSHGIRQRNSSLPLQQARKGEKFFLIKFKNFKDY